MTGGDVALKIGHLSSSPSRLEHEHSVYTAIAGSKGIAQVLWYGKEGLYEVIVLDHLGTSLDDIIDEPTFDHEKTFVYAIQMVRSLYKTNDYTNTPGMQLSIVQSLHDQHYVHCDIKPGNFMIHGDTFSPTLFLIDFGLARLFRNPATYLHIPFTTDHSIIGTLPFTSINGQQGNSQSRRDDLESLAYTIIYVALGDLPWTSNSTGNNKQAVLRKKKSITTEELCKGLPSPFCKFVDHVRALGFHEKPDYQYLHSVLLQCSEIGDHVPVFAGRV
jgi:serine/threonine protein kinase